MRRQRKAHHIFDMVKCNFRCNGHRFGNAERLFQCFFFANVVGGAFWIDIIAQSLSKVTTIPHHKLLTRHYVTYSIKINIVLVLACNQVHDLKTIGGCHKPHPIRMCCIRSIQIIVIIIFEYLLNEFKNTINGKLNFDSKSIGD